VESGAEGRYSLVLRGTPARKHFDLTASPLSLPLSYHPSLSRTLQTKVRVSSQTNNDHDTGSVSFSSPFLSLPLPLSLLSFDSFLSPHLSTSSLPPLHLTSPLLIALVQETSTLIVYRRIVEINRLSSSRIDTSPFQPSVLSLSLLFLCCTVRSHLDLDRPDSFPSQLR